MAETIFAQATPPGRSGIAVIRISGPSAAAGAAALGAARAPLRRAVLRRLRDPRDGFPIDDALVLRFAGPASFTGEDSVELHLHGGPAVCRAVAAALAALPDMREAEPGEFTRRALINGRLDLAQAEGLGDLLAAETAAQARRALALMDGALSRAALGWRERLVRALALIEAAVDFADEDLPPDALGEAAAILGEMGVRLRAELAGAAASERLRIGYEVAIVGPPNVGKSTLLNALARRDAAIISDVAGTTRDVIEARAELRGLPVVFADMAGLRDARDPVERIGVERARRRAAAADLRVVLVDQAEDAAALGVALAPGDQVVLAKGDLRPPDAATAVSGLTGRGVPELLARITAELETRAASATLIGHERQQRAVGRALEALQAAAEALAGPAPAPELAAAEVHAALRSLDFLLGRIDVEAVLDVVFASFCIGK
jgi:tRNA modification GTPase